MIIAGGEAFRWHFMEAADRCDMLRWRQSPVESNMIGRQLGRWVIDRELGKGAMGSVYFAHAADAPTQVRAVKVLAPDLARDRVSRDRFERETDVLCHLDHPNIVRFDGAGNDGETLYYVMEFIDGPDCETRLREIGRWHWSEVIDLAIQVVRGLKYAHDQGIIHRDLKPANILLATTNGKSDEAAAKDVDAESHMVAKIADFGVARVFSQGQLTGSGHFVGTALYMAPEQAAGKPATKRSDFYALGCLMYTLLTGRPPFNGNSLAELVHKHQFAQPERPARLLSDLPHDVDELVVQLLSKQPMQRPADGSILLKRLESIRGKLARVHQVADTPFRVSPEKVDVRSLEWSIPQLDVEAASAQGGRGKLVRALLLFAALVVVVTLIVIKLSRPRATVEEMFNQADQLLHSQDPADWDRAWSDYLDPMISRFPDHPYQKQVEAFRVRREEQAALRRLAAVGHRGGFKSEAQRFFEQGLSRCQAGDIEGGRHIWRQLIDVFGTNTSERGWVMMAQRGLETVQPRAAAAAADMAEVKESLERARGLRDSGHRDQAETIWKGLEELYRDDPSWPALRDVINSDRAKGP
jgi:eukaryotic-like serine/threonine-protein kinase